MDLSFNKIKWILEDEFSVNKNIKELILSNNPLTKFSSKLISPLHKLELLDLSDTQIEYIDGESFANNPHFKELNLKNTALKHFNFNAFSPKAELVDVQLPSNIIEMLDISCSSVCHFKNFHSDDFFENIRVFEAVGNNNQNIPKLLKKIGSKVEILDLSQNSIRTIDDSILNCFTELKFLNLSHSKVSKIEKDALVRQNQLVDLDLSNNELKDIDSVTFSFRSLLHLNLASNQLTKITKDIPNILRNLQTLKILNNPLDPVRLKDFLDRFNFSKVEIDAKSNAQTTQVTTETTTNAEIAVTTPFTTENSPDGSSSAASNLPTTPLTLTTTIELHQNIETDTTANTKKLLYLTICVGLIIITIIVTAIVLYYCLRKTVKISSVDLITVPTISTNPKTFIDDHTYDEIIDPMPSAYAVTTVHHSPHYENVPAHTTTLDRYHQNDSNYNASNEYATVYHHYATISKPKTKHY